MGTTGLIERTTKASGAVIASIVQKAKRPFAGLSFPQGLAFTVKKKVHTSIELEKENLFGMLCETKTRLDTLRSGYDQQTNFDMVDVYIHAITSAEKEYSHLLKEARRVDLHKEYSLKD